MNQARATYPIQPLTNRRVDKEETRAKKRVSSCDAEVGENDQGTKYQVAKCPIMMPMVKLSKSGCDRVGIVA